MAWQNHELIHRNTPKRGTDARYRLLVGSYHLGNMVGEEQDIIGFDPRGIGATTPRADCFAYPLNSSPSDDSAWQNLEEDVARGNYHRTIWDISGKEAGNVNTTSGSLQKLDTRARTLAKLCEEKDSLNGKDSILKYVHTPSVARDMISIVDAWDEWTASLEKDSTASCHGKVVTPETELAKADHEEKDSENPLDTKGKLVYWGFSYGVGLGIFSINFRWLILLDIAWRHIRIYVSRSSRACGSRWCCRR